MKSPFLVGLGVLCLGSLILNAYQWQRYREVSQSNIFHQPFASTENDFSERASERKKELLQKRLHALEKEKSRLKIEKNSAMASLSTNEIGKTEERRGDNSFRELLRSPEMKDFMKARQRGVLSDSYKDFVNQAALSPQEREKFLDLLAENQMQWMDRAPRGAQSSTNQLTATEGKTEAELQKLLGPTRYAQYESYQKTIGQRMALNQFEQQIALGETPLQSYQKDQLLQILTEENRNNPFSGMRQREMMQTLSQSDETAANQYFENQRQATERALVRAQTVLNPKQFEQFKEFQNGMLKLHETGFKAFRERANRQN